MNNDLLVEFHSLHKWRCTTWLVRNCRVPTLECVNLWMVYFQNGIVQMWLPFLF